MEKKAAWSLFEKAVKEGGDLEFIELDGLETGKTYRARIRRIIPNTAHTQLSLVFGLSAFQFANRNWRETKSCPSMIFSEEKFMNAEEGLNGQIEFETELKKGRYYPPGQNLIWSKVIKT